MSFDLIGEREDIILFSSGSTTIINQSARGLTLVLLYTFFLIPTQLPPPTLSLMPDLMSSVHTLTHTYVVEMFMNFFKNILYFDAIPNVWQSWEQFKELPYTLYPSPLFAFLSDLFHNFVSFTSVCTHTQIHVYQKYLGANFIQIYHLQKCAICAKKHIHIKYV